MGASVEAAAPQPPSDQHPSVATSHLTTIYAPCSQRQESRDLTRLVVGGKVEMQAVLDLT